MLKILMTWLLCDERQLELINNKNIKGKFPVRIMLKDVFRFAEHQKKLPTDWVVN